MRAIQPDCQVAADADIAKVSVLGVGMRTHTGVARRMFGALAERGINIGMISTSEVRVGVVVDLERGQEALAVYRWYTPLLHLDTHVKLVQYIKLASAECGYGSELCRPPRLPLVGAEREEVLRIIRQAIATRPK